VGLHRVEQPTTQASLLVPIAIRVQGKTIIADALASDTIGDLKALIAARIKIHPGRQVLICNGQQLQDNRTLSEYNLQDGNSVLRLLFKMAVSAD
jgi:ubiquitin C